MKLLTVPHGPGVKPVPESKTAIRGAPWKPPLPLEHGPARRY